MKQYKEKNQKNKYKILLKKKRKPLNDLVHGKYEKKTKKCFDIINNSIIIVNLLNLKQTNLI